jgi:midasin, putative
MKDYQLYLEKITNALSRAGISYPAPSFSDYEGMWSYVEGLSSFLELNAQLQKSGAGVVLMGLEESTTFKSYWNSEFYQEFQERKLLESKISSNLNHSEIESDGEETYLDDSAEFSPDAHENDSKTNALASSLVVGSVVGSVLGSSLVDGVDASEVEVQEEVVKKTNPLEGYNSSNVVFIDDEEDEEDVRYDEDGFVIEDEDDLEEEDGSGSPVKEVSPPSLEGYDSSNIVFVDDDTDSEYTYDDFGNKYDKDGFIVMDDDDEEEDSNESDDLSSSSEDSDDGYTYDEFGNKYDSDGFLVEDEDEEEVDSSANEGITYEPDGTYYDEYGNHFDSDGFLIEDEEKEFESEEPQPQVEADGSYYDEYGNHFDADGFLIEDDDDLEEESQPQVESDGSYYDEYGNHFDADGFLIEDEDEVDEDSDESESSKSSSNVQPDGSYYDEFGNHYDADGFLIEDEDEVLEEDEFPSPTQRVSTPSQPSAPVREAREEVVSPPQKPKIIMPKEVQTADKIMSLFGGMESKLRKKVQDVKKPKN